MVQNASPKIRIVDVEVGGPGFQPLKASSFCDSHSFGYLHGHTEGRWLSCLHLKSAPPVGPLFLFAWLSWQKGVLFFFYALFCISWSSITNGSRLKHQFDSIEPPLPSLVRGLVSSSLEGLLLGQVETMKGETNSHDEACQGQDGTGASAGCQPNWTLRLSYHKSSLEQFWVDIGVHFYKSNPMLVGFICKTGDEVDHPCDHYPAYLLMNVLIIKREKFYSRWPLPNRCLLAWDVKTGALSR
ncbi:hypothetical protein VNO77_34373 [Canavalia gladiata]|uniref:Uncharacterized protein n=1 Tax=Canavalia gladiata TaxID=3824 RepID=A0AAN9KE46_CANGL